jgi:hypothetical protein
MNNIQRMKDLIQTVEKTKLNESCEAPYSTYAPTAAEQPGSPVSMNVSINASGKDHVNDLLDIMKNAGLSKAEDLSVPGVSMRSDIEKFRGAVDGQLSVPSSDMSSDMEGPEMDISVGDMNMDAMGPGDDLSKEGFDNEPSEDYADHNYMTQELSGGINRKKGAYAASQDGDNAMAVRIKEQLLKKLKEKMSKPDFLDVDKDGDKKEPMKKALQDKKKNKS